MGIGRYGEEGRSEILVLRIFSINLFNFNIFLIILMYSCDGYCSTYFSLILILIMVMIMIILP